MLVTNPRKKLSFIPGAKQNVGDIRQVPTCTELDMTPAELHELSRKRSSQNKYDSKGFDSFGFDKEGYDKDGINFDGFNRKGEKVRDSPFEALEKIFAKD